MTNALLAESFPSDKRVWQSVRHKHIFYSKIFGLKLWNFVWRKFVQWPLIQTGHSIRCIWAKKTKSIQTKLKKINETLICIFALYGFPRFWMSWGKDEKLSSKSFYYILEIQSGSFRQRLRKSNLLFCKNRFEQFGLSLSLSLVS